jgi:hypothetical protein
MNLEPAAPILRPPVSCHREMPWISLATSAEVPQGGTALPERERQRLLQDILECRRCVLDSQGCIPHRQHAGDCEIEIDPREVMGGWRKFFLAHYAFFHAFGLLAARYRESAAALERRSWPLGEIEQACSLWRLAGALMLYGVDFTPTEAIYERHIRPQMPEAFSGTWLREYILLTAQKRRFQRALDGRSADHPRLVQDLRARLHAAEKRYHELHFQVMLACVPDMTSKLQAYQFEHGDFKLGERHFQAYDEWFHVLRVELDLSGYVRSVCAVCRELVADLAGGTLMAADPLAELIGGLLTVLRMLRSALCLEAEEALEPVQ